MKIVLVLKVISLFIFQIKSDSLLVKTEVYPVHPTSFYQCFRSNGQSKIGLYLFPFGNGQFIFNICLEDINNAKNAGLQVQVLYYADPKLDTMAQIQNMLKYFGTQKIKRFWVMIPYPDGGNINIFHSAEEICNYTINLVDSFRKNRLNAEIITDRQRWLKYFKQNECLELGQRLLFWIPESSQIDDSPNFNKYIKFGGWNAPFMKEMESRKSICGASFVINYLDEHN